MKDITNCFTKFLTMLPREERLVNTAGYETGREKHHWVCAWVSHDSSWKWMEWVGADVHLPLWTESKVAHGTSLSGWLSLPQCPNRSGQPPQPPAEKPTKPQMSSQLPATESMQVGLPKLSLIKCKRQREKWLCFCCSTADYIVPDKSS